MKMRFEKVIRQWEPRQQHCTGGDKIDRLLQRQRSIRRMKTPMERRIEKYGIDNYLAHSDEYVA